MSYKEIANLFEQNGIKVSPIFIEMRCKKIYQEKEKEEPKAIRKSIKKDIPDEEIYELREQGMSYKDIAKYFENKGIKVTRIIIGIRCKEIYEEKGQEEPKAIRKSIKKDIPDEEIYKLREQGMTYQAIAKYFEEKGIEIAWGTIRERCKKIYEEKGKEEPKAIRKSIKKDTPDEEIYKLREQGMSYRQIETFLRDRGEEISFEAIRNRCKAIYEKEGKEEPEEIRKRIKKDIPDEEIYELREQGMSYKAIAKYFEEKGIKINWGTIRERCKEVYEEKGKEEPKVIRKGRKKDVTDEEIYELREQGRTYEDIAIHFEKKGIKVSWMTIRKRCKKIYAEKDKEEPILKPGPKKHNKKTEESLGELNEILNDRIKKKMEMEKILNILTDYIARNTEGVEK